MTSENALSVAIERGNVMAADCPSREVLRHVTSLWGVLTLITLTKGSYRFSALRRHLGGVSERMLAQTLRHLEQDGFVHRRDYHTMPPRVEYSLTEAGQAVASRVAELADWIEDYSVSL